MGGLNIRLDINEERIKEWNNEFEEMSPTKAQSAEAQGHNPLRMKRAVNF